MDYEHEIVVYDGGGLNNWVKIFVCELWLIVNGDEVNTRNLGRKKSCCVRDMT